MRVTVSKVRPVQTLSYPERLPQVMPVALAEVGLPGVQRAPMPATMPASCRSDAVQIDGDAVPVVMVGSTADAAAGKPVDLQRCPAVDASVRLERGDHVVRSAPGATTGIDVDGLVLGSEAGGGAMALGARGTLPTTITQAAARPAATPKVKVTSKGSTKIQLQITGAKKGTPFWLVLGESNNAGWEASVDGTNVGGSTLVNGYANGWRVQPPSGSFSVTLTWTPQRNVWIAIGISLLALLLCLVLALRRPARAGPGADSDEDLDDALVALANPLVATGDRPRPLPVAVGAIALGIVGAAVSSVWVGVVVAVLVAAVAWWPRARFLVSLGAPSALAVAALYVIVQQHRYDYVADLDWPARFTRVNDLAWLAVLLLVADVVIEALRRRATARADA